MFVVTKPVHDKEELRHWYIWFEKRGLKPMIRHRQDGRFDLLREGEEAPTDMPCTPTIGPCIRCGSKPPHAFGHYKFCSAICMNEYRKEYSRRIIH